MKRKIGIIILYTIIHYVISSSPERCAGALVG